MNNDEKLVEFFYGLIRDEVTPGTIELVFKNHVTGNDNNVYTNKFLEGYARDLVKRLKS